MTTIETMVVTGLQQTTLADNSTTIWTILPTSVDPNTTDNVTEEPNFPAGYPSGYTWPHIILAAALVTVVILMIIIGNFLVIWAIITDRNLKATQNLFIASLALADFLIGIIIIPFSLANELMGYWYFGTVWCELWKATDVLLCTASISSLCLISLDRYWSITRAVHYSRQRTPRRAYIMIGIIWVVSAAVCIPPLIGWKQPHQNDSVWPLCTLSEDIGYVLYSSMGSFYIPAVIMVFVYFKIYQAAKMRARKNVTKMPKATMGGKGDHKNSTESSVTEQCHETKCHDDHMELELGNVGNELTTMYTAVTTTDDETPTQVQSSDTNTTSHPLPSDELAKLISTDSDSTCDFSSRTLNKGDNSSRLGTATLLTSDTESSSEQHRGLLSPNGKDKEAARNSGSDQGNGQVQKFTIVEPKQNGTPVLSSSRQKRERSRFLGNITRHLFNANRDKKTPKKSDEKNKQNTDYFSAEKHKRKLAKARERRATVVLGLVMAAFILCWFPFFSLYVASAFCEECIPVMVFTVFFWIGYCNSALNPIIYTVFNRDFRKAFAKILFRRRPRRGR